MEILKTSLGLAVLQVLWIILGSVGLSDIPDYSSPGTHAHDYVQLDHFRHKREATPASFEYIIETEVNVSSVAVVEKLKCLLLKVSFPHRLNNAINITDINPTTVCFTSGCNNLSDTDGSFCSDNSTTSEYIIEIEVNVSSLAVIEELKHLLDEISFPHQLDNAVNMTDVSLFQVCCPSGCINPAPNQSNPNEPFCPADPTTAPATDNSTTSEYIIEIEVNVSSLAVIEELKHLFDEISFPHQLDNAVNMTDVNLFQVCCPSGCINPAPNQSNPNEPFCPDPTTAPPTDNSTTSEYIIEIEVNVSSLAVIEELKHLLDEISFPHQLDNAVNMTDVNLFQVCCPSGCINPAPNQSNPNKPFCPDPTTAPPTDNSTTSEYIIEIEVNVSSLAVIEELKHLLDNISFPHQLDNAVNMTDVNLFQVCCPSGCINPAPNQSNPNEPFCPDPTAPATVSSTITPMSTTIPDSRTSTPSSTTKLERTTLTTTPITAEFKLNMSFKITNKDFHQSLSIPSSQNYTVLEADIRTATENGYKNITGFVGISDINFKSGSVLTEYILGTKEVRTSQIDEGNQEVVRQLGTLGYAVDITSFTALLSENKFDDTLDLLVSGDDFTLNCNPTVDLPGQSAKWKRNDLEINNQKYAINNEKLSLTANNSLQIDSGNYKCCVTMGFFTFIRGQIITVNPEPTVYVEPSNKEIRSLCSSVVPLECCGNAPKFSLEWTNHSSKPNEFTNNGCIFKNSICQDGEETQISTCKMTFRKKTFKREVSVRFLEDDKNFTCNEPYGPGEEGENVEIFCEKGIDGIKTIQCENGTWMVVNSTCLIPEIKQLLLESETLEQQMIGSFLKRLNNVTKFFEEEVVISNENIFSLVETLNNVVNVTNASFNEDQTKDFLEIVDILISNDTVETWNSLNANNTRDETSSNLLKSVERFSSFINDTNFSIQTERIQLQKTTFSNDFDISFNSTDDELMVLSSTNLSAEIVTVHFRTLDIALPSRNLTSPNNMINGAVILVYTNGTTANVSLTFDKRNTSLVYPQCVFWNFTEIAWDSSGCEVHINGNETITCVCDHLTSFSILMSPSIPEAIRIILDFITYIGVSISMASLIVCLIIEAIVWTTVTRNDISYMRHVTIVNIAVSLLIANIWFMIGAGISDINRKTPVGPCSAATFFSHFFYLALFFWMLFSALLLFHRMVMVFSHMSKKKMMAIAFTIGYGAPLIIAVITVAVTAPQNGYFRENDACWLAWKPTLALLAFVIPALVIVATNFLVLIMVLYKLLRRTEGENVTDERNALMVIARCVALLTPFFGLTWGFGIGTMIAPNEAGLHIVFTVLNSLQGFFVLVFGTLLDSRIRTALAGKFSFLHTSSNRTRSTSGGPTSSSGLDFFRRRRGDPYNVTGAASSSHSTSASESALNT
ncbi:hypothetical protein GJAV_G00117450 [Gymnothorax javanicus]|nr:hypothetical protein GJAV_G00117450 [Gymnothorax javanicus]